MSARFVRMALCFLGLCAGAAAAEVDDDGTKELRWGAGTVLFLRHAPAPGFGDPDGFRLGDCATQRNLDAAGREVARRIGLALRRSAPPIRAVYSSEWCRCLETAALLGLGGVVSFSGLNSFFQGLAPKRGTMAKLRAFLAGLEREGAPVLMVTHYVVIGELTGIYPPSGGLVAYDLERQTARSVPLRLPPLPEEEGEKN